MNLLSTRTPALAAVVAAAMALGMVPGCATQRAAAPAAIVHGVPLNVVVMDPLCARLACACVTGYAQRDYRPVATVLEKRLKRPVRLVVAESLPEAVADAPGLEPIHLIIGKYGVVSWDARHAGLPMRPVAMLTDQAGRVSFHGVFVVRQADPAKTIEDLQDRSLLIGPKEAIEKHAAALTELEVRGVKPRSVHTSPACSTAAVAVLEKGADAAVISSYTVPLLVGCGTVGKDELRVIGRTDEVPFVAVFAGDALSPAETAAVQDALRDASRDRRVLQALESKAGFVTFHAEDRSGHGPSGDGPWPDWRGARRNGHSPFVPRQLTAAPMLLWQHPLTGLGLAGLTVTRNHVILADKDLNAEKDVFRCLDAMTGAEVWQLAYSAPSEMDYSNSPRAQPVAHDGLVYLLGAFGDLHCVRETDGKTVWRCNILKQFGAKLPTWGTCATPLVVDDRIIVNPGGPAASLVALDRRTGRVLWETPGNPPGYSSFILGTFGGRRQIVGYDSISLGGWDPATGKRLWTLTPPVEGDFNVPTPIDVDGNLFVASENNGARLYGFDRDGRIRPRPLAVNPDLAPDTVTPVFVNGVILGNAGGELLCLDPKKGLKPCWSVKDEDYDDYCTYLAGKDHVLITTLHGDVRLINCRKDRLGRVARTQLFRDAAEDREVWSHPALAGNRFYIRDQARISCFLLEMER